MTEEELARSLFPQPQASPSEQLPAEVSYTPSMAVQFANNNVSGDGADTLYQGNVDYRVPMPTDQNFDYGVQNPDVQAEAFRVLGAGADRNALEDFYRQHYQTYGINEGRVAPPNFAVNLGGSNLAANVPQTNVTGPYAVQDIGYGGTADGYYDADGNFFYGAPNITTPISSYAVPENYGNPKNKIYQLSAAPDEGVRLVGLDGTVYYEGKGDEAARTAAEIVQQLGKQFNTGATWKLEKKAPGSDSWTQVSQDTVGKQKTTALNSFLNYALPIAGSFLPGVGPALGAALGSGLNSALQTKPLDVALRDAALSAGASYLGGKIAPGLGGSGGTGQLIGSAGVDTLAQVGTDAVVEGVIVEAAKQGVQLTAAQALALLAAGGGTIAGALSAAGAGGTPTVEGVDVVAQPQSGYGTPVTTPGLDPSNIAPAIPPGVNPVMPNTSPITPNAPDPLVPFVPTVGVMPPNVPTITPDKPLTLSDVTDLITSLGGLGALGAGAGGSSGGGGPYQRAPIFSAQLPQAKGIYANLSPRNTSGIDYKNYGYGPERSFFANVPDRAVGEQYVVPVTPPTPATPTTPTTPTTPSTPAIPNKDFAAYLTANADVLAAANANPGAYGDMNKDGKIDNLDFAIGHYLQYGINENRPFSVAPSATAKKPVQEIFTVFQDETAPFTAEQKNELAKYLVENINELDPNSGTYKMLKAQGYKRGGFAVEGPGTGRSDEIDAKLSDGEYVIDAETVALLGDGSSKAGAKKLDQFRVNVRKHKGAELSKGKFSVDAKAPEAYMSGGRT